MRQAQILTRILGEAPLVTAMAAHSPLGALLAEEAGFDAIWASGFELSAAFGVPDASIVSSAEHLESTRRIVESVGIPVIADLDTGYGDAENVLHVVRRYALAGAAAVVIEDKTFPKETSLSERGGHVLVPADVFKDKIRAAVDARGDAGTVVVARTEALIAGLGVAEALSRAEQYEEAGADMIFVHSKAETPIEIEEFAVAWGGKLPLAIAPTAYPSMTEEKAIALRKVKLLIYANHGLRSVVHAMRETFARIRACGSAEPVEGDIASVQEVIRLQHKKTARHSASPSASEPTRKP